MPLDQRVKELITHIIPPLLEMYESEDNKYVSSSFPSVMQVLLLSDESIILFEALRADET